MKVNAPFFILLIFFIVRIILNLKLEILQIIFVVIYLILIFLLVKRHKIFTKFLVWFLIIDSLIGIYFLIIKVLDPLIYIGTILINLIIIWIALKFEKKILKK